MFEEKLRTRTDDESESQFTERATKEVRDTLCRKVKFARFARENDHKRIFEMVTSPSMSVEEFAKMLLLIDIRIKVEAGEISERDGMSSFLELVKKRSP
jgi:hypothetical protein